MVADLLSHERENGVYYTPDVLAEFLAHSTLTACQDWSVLDPAYGEGSLLLAAEKVHAAMRPRQKLDLFGCDIKPVNGLLRHLPKANLKKINFFRFSAANKFSAILMNPPYVRHHFQSDANLSMIRKRIPEMKVLTNSSDLWAYFLIKGMAHLKCNGTIGAILPWSFLQADYAKPLRKLLTEKFGSIRVLALSEEYFPKAKERVVIVWLKAYGNKCELIEMAYSNTISKTISYAKISSTQWLSSKVNLIVDKHISKLFLSIKSEFGFSELDNYADILIGVVTGADNFFIRSKDEIKDLEIQPQNLIPIITTSKEFVQVSINGIDSLKRLVTLSRKDYHKYRAFISHGRNQLFHLRAHSLLRNPWYAVKVGRIPDAFFPYRVSAIPYLLNNSYRIQSTNSVHRIYYKDVSDVERKWIEVSLLSAIGQLSIEMLSKTYGRGMLKIEPGSLKKVLVLKRADESINIVYDRVVRALNYNNKRHAAHLATEFIFQELGIDGVLRGKILNALDQLQTLRLVRVASTRQESSHS